MWAVVGLGNPGIDYSKTRHNIGFTFIKRVAKEWNVRLKKRIYLSKAAIVEKDNENILLAMPQTYMNNSGLAVKKIMEGIGINSEHLLVAFDDLDIPLGEVRIRKEGGGGTHKGVNSIIREINTTRFPRIRLGIGLLEPGKDAAEYVLSPFQKDEKPLVEEVVIRAQKALSFILKDEIEKAMNFYNQKIKTV